MTDHIVTTRQPTHQVQDERELLPRPSTLEGTWTTRRRVVNGRRPAPGGPISTQGRYGRRGKAHKESLARHLKANVAYVPCATQAPRRRHAGATQAPRKRHAGATQAPRKRHAGATQAPHAPGRRLEVDAAYAPCATSAPRRRHACTWPSPGLMWPVPLAPLRHYACAMHALTHAARLRPTARILGEDK